jgi:hypothetical protein
MKTSIILLVVVLFTTQAFGQRKSKKETAAADSCKVQIDSLNKVTQSLTLRLDSVSSELTKFMEVYIAIKEKVIHYNFDPTRSSFLIDSMKASRDSASAELFGNRSASSDSISALVKENNILKFKIDSVKVAWARNMEAINAMDVDKVKAVSSLKQLRELLDSKIITDAEFTLLKKKYLEKL